MWQSVPLLIHLPGMRIATPVFALARNDMVIVTLCNRFNMIFDYFPDIDSGRKGKLTTCPRKPQQRWVLHQIRISCGLAAGRHSKRSWQYR